MSATTKTPTTADVTTRAALLSDYSQIAALTARNELGVKPEEEWRHLWVNNPVYKKTPGWEIGWVLEHDGQIVGFLGNIPLSFQFKGREIISACTFSMSADHAYRGHAIRLIRRLLKWGTHLECHFCTTANPNSSRLIKALKLPPVPTGDYGTSTFWITNYHKFLASVLERKGWPQMLAYPASVGLALKEEVTKSRAWMGHGSEVQQCASFDERFDVFWEELPRAYPNRLLAKRSREVLEWHFRYPLAQNHAWIATLNQGSRMIAYAIFCRCDSPKFHLQRMRLVDFQVLNGDHQLLIPMLAWGVRKSQEEGIHMLEAFGFRPDKQCVIDKVAPYRRPLESWGYFYRTVHDNVRQELQDVDIWDPCHLDGDASL